MTTSPPPIKPVVLILIDTYQIGGPGKLILDYLNSGAKEWGSPLVAGCFRGPPREWPFREAILEAEVPFVTLRQKFAFDPFAIWEAIKVVRKYKINIIESHGYKAHFIAFL